MATPRTDTDVTAARLAALHLPDPAGWTAPARHEALSRLTAMGLPGRRDEYWRFTNPAGLSATEPAASTPASSADEAPLFNDRDRLKVVFVDGTFSAEDSDALDGTGLEIATLREAQNVDIHWARALYGTLEERGQDPVRRPLAALNTAFATDGLLIRATGKVARPVAVTYRQTDATADPILHNVVRIEEGAELTLLEDGEGGARFNAVTEFDLADTAVLHHVRSQGRAHGRQAATANFARLGRSSVFKSFTLTANGVMIRNENVIEMLGDDAVAHVAGAAIGDAARDAFHQDDTVFVTHDALNCESRQVFKKVLKNGAVGVFQGKILVKQGAQKTDGYQISQSLLLDDDSQFLAKPELEIYADDVACSHGSTTGAIDDTALFYLRSRGVPRRDAEDLLVLSFLAEALEEIDDPSIAEELTERLANWLARRRG